MTPFKVSGLFEVTYTDLNPIIIHEGGTSSGKTWSILQCLILWAIANHKQVTTVVGQDIPNLKKGSYRDIQNIIADSPFCAYHLLNHNKTDRVFEFRSGSNIEFVSFEDFQDAKNGKRDRLFCNELNGISYPVFAELQQRTRINTLADFNPTAHFWAHDKLARRDDVSWYVSNFAHNPFIDTNVLATIKGYEPTPDNIARGTADEWRWKVYGLGEVGRLEGVVFENWKHGTWPESPQWTCFGMDFGFTNDPTTLIEVALSGGELFARERIYSTGMTNGDISERLRALGLTGSDTIVCDSAEPKSIEELYRMGWNVIPAVKGPDSVTHGIDTLKRYPLNVCGESPNLTLELRNYKWATDREGRSMNKPVDSHNHAIDAMRYAVTHMVRPPAVSFSFG